MDKFRSNRFEIEQINRLLEKAVPLKSLNLYKGLSNWCPYGEINLSAKDFIDHNQGIAMKNSQINRPPWMDWVEYDDFYNKTIQIIILIIKFLIKFIIN